MHFTDLQPTMPQQLHQIFATPKYIGISKQYGTNTNNWQTCNWLGGLYLFPKPKGIETTTCII